MIHMISILVARRFLARHAPSMQVPAKAIASMSGSSRLSDLLLYPVMLFGTSFGPIAYYGFFLRKLLTGKGIPRVKTER